MRKFATIALAAFIYMAATAQTPEGYGPSQDVGLNMANSAVAVTIQADSVMLAALLPTGGSFSWRDRYDKLNSQPENIISIYNYLKRQDKGFSDIFVATDTVPGQDYITANLNAIRKLKAAGIPVPAVEFVNEAFYGAGGYSFDWAKYEPALTPFLEAVHAEFPEIVFALPIAPKPLDLFTKLQGGGKNHQDWNEALFAYTEAHPQYKFGGSIHIYYTGAFVAAFGSGNTTDETGNKVRVIAPAKRVYNYATDTIDEAYWRDVYRQSDPAPFWEPLLNYLQAHNLPAYVTECGYIDAGSLNGTWAYAAGVFELVNKYGRDPRVASLNVHGGFTESRVGVWGPRETYDIRDLYNPNNVGSPTADGLTMYFNAPGGLYYYRPAYNITAPGVYSFWFTTETGFVPAITASEGLSASYTVQAVKGAKFSAQGVSMAHNKRGSVLGPSEVLLPAYYPTAPPLSFGYVIVTVTRPGCLDPAATNYNPAATVGDGSCVYPPPPPPPVIKCRKNFWQFWLPKCAPAVYTPIKSSQN